VSVLGRGLQEVAEVAGEQVGVAEYRAAKPHLRDLLVEHSAAIAD
jgi:hypothetical protein